MFFHDGHILHNSSPIYIGRYLFPTGHRPRPISTNEASSLPTYEGNYKYLFATPHSPFIMIVLCIGKDKYATVQLHDDVQLKLHKPTHIVCKLWFLQPCKDPSLAGKISVFSGVFHTNSYKGIGSLAIDCGKDFCHITSLTHNIFV